MWKYESFSGLPINVDNIASISGNGLSTLSDKLKESNITDKLESMSGNLTEQLGGVTEQLSSIDTSAIQGQLGNVGKSLGQMNIPGLGGLG